MLRAVSGFCPWATAKLVITPAPRQATASWVVRAGRGSTGLASAPGSLGVVPAESCVAGVLRYWLLMFFMRCNACRKGPLIRIEGGIVCIGSMQSRLGCAEGLSLL